MMIFRGDRPFFSRAGSRQAGAVPLTPPLIIAILLTALLVGAGVWFLTRDQSADENKTPGQSTSTAKEGERLATAPRPGGQPASGGPDAPALGESSASSDLDSVLARVVQKALPPPEDVDDQIVWRPNGGSLGQAGLLVRELVLNLDGVAVEGKLSEDRAIFLMTIPARQVDDLVRELQSEGTLRSASGDVLKRGPEPDAIMLYELTVLQP